MFYKHRNNGFFPPASYVLSFVLTQLPQSLIECVIYSQGVYWISGLTRNASNYFLFLLVIFSVNNGAWGDGGEGTGPTLLARDWTATTSACILVVASKSLDGERCRVRLLRMGYVVWPVFCCVPGLI